MPKETANKESESGLRDRVDSAVTSSRSQDQKEVIGREIHDNLNPELPQLPQSVYGISHDLISLMAEHVEGQGHAILFVDDEPETVRSLMRLFRDKYEVLTACSSSEAIQILNMRAKSSSPVVCVAISDQRMPVQTGAQFFAAIRTIHPVTIRILMTAYTDINAVIEAINTGGVQQYITKPIDLEKFSQVLRESVAMSILMQQIDEEFKEFQGILDG